MSQEIRVVIVDDSEDLLRAYEKYFQIAGLNVIAKFSNPEKAVSYFSSKKSDLGNSIVVILDSRIPDTNSLEVARKLKELNPELKIILTTSGNHSLFNTEENLFDGMISKPFSLSELLEVIKNVTSVKPAKGSWIFEAEDVDKKYQELLTESNESVNMCLSSEGVKRRLNVHGYIPYYVRVRSKGLKVKLVTEITNDNLFYCKELMINRGVELRHLEGTLMNFSVWDQKHTLEAAQTSGDSSLLKRIFYSNIESVVAKNQFLFDQLWSLAVPGDHKIRELETASPRHRVKLVSGLDEILRTRMRIIREAQVSIDNCATPEAVTNLIIPRLGQEYSNAARRGVMSRLLYEIPEGGVSAYRDLTKLGFEVKHLPNLVGSFLLSEKELLGAALKEPQTNQDPVSIYSDFPELVRQHHLVFDLLWNHAIAGSERIKEVEDKQKIANA